MAEDFVFNVLLKAENGQLVGQVKQAKAGFEALQASAGTSKTALDGLKTSTDRVKSSAAAVGTEWVKASSAAGQLRMAARSAEYALQRQTAAQDNAGRSSGGLRQASTQLSFQIQDVTQQMALGVDPLIIFAQQQGQVAFAMSQFGGAVGKLGAALSGPWAAAILGGVTVLGFMAKAFFDNKKAADDTSDSLLALETQTKNLSEAERIYRELLGESVLTQRGAALQAIELANQRYNAAIATREAARDELVYVRALFEAQKARASGPGQAGELAALGLAGRIADIESVEKKLNAADQRAATIGQAWERGLKRVSSAGLEVDKLLAGTSGKIKEATAETEKAGKATGGLVKAQDDYARSLAALQDRYDPLAAAARKYREELAEIALLQGAGAISGSQSRLFQLGASEADDKRLREITAGNLSESFREAIKQPVVDFGLRVADSLEKGGKKAADNFNRETLVFAEAIGQAIGGSAGKSLQGIVGVIAGLEGGDFTAAGTRTGGVLTLFSTAFGKSGPFADGMKDAIRPLKDLFKDLPGKLGIGEAAQRTIGKIAGGAILGGSVARAAGGSALGGSIGGALGSGLASITSVAAFLGPVGAALAPIVGGLLGGVLGGVLKKKPKGYAALSGVDDVSVTGNKASAREAAGTLGGAVQDGLRRIAEQLGGTLGGFAVTIGTYNGKARINTTGAAALKSGKPGVVDFGKGGEEQAVSAAIRDAIADGAVAGLSAAVRRALASSTDVNKAVKEAVGVKGVEELLGGIAGAAKRAFAEFEKTAAERNRVARAYGFDLVELERVNAEQRAALLEGQIGGAVGNLKRLLDDLKFGGKAGGSAVERRAALLTEAGGLEEKAKTSPAAANRLAEIYDLLYDVSQEAFGTAGQFAGDRSRIQSTAERLVADTEARLRADQAAAQKTAGTDAAAAKLDTTNATLDEMADQLAAINAGIGRLIGLNGLGGGLGGGDAALLAAQARAIGAIALGGVGGLNAGVDYR